MKTNAPKTEVVKFRLSVEEKKILEKIADSEQRTLAGQIRLALIEWIVSTSKRKG